jgi:hypothetical protein
MAYNPKLEQELISIKNLSNALGKAEGTVISVSGAGTVSGLTLTGTVTTSGDLTLGGTLSLTSANVTDALTFTPYNATNPSSFTSNLGIVQSVTSNAGTLGINANGVLNVPPTAGAPVDSVNTLTGAVVLNTGNIAEGSNLYYTNARVSANTDVEGNTLKISFDNTSSTRLANTSGTNTGDQDLSSYALTSAIPTNNNQLTNGAGYTGDQDLSVYQLLSQKDSANGYVGLDSNSKINSSQLPAIAITDTFVVTSEADMLALAAEVGDVAVRTDIESTFILRVAGATSLVNWTELETPTGSVSSVFGRSGVISAQSGDYTKEQVGLGNVPNTNFTSAVGLNTNKISFDNTSSTRLADTSGTNTGDQTLSGLGGVAGNTAIIAGTNTKITYDAKGLVTAGSAATTADINASTDRNYVTDAQATVINNTSGINTGDQNLTGYVTLATAQTISGAKTFSDSTTTLVKIIGNETSDNTAQLIIASGGVDKNSIIHFTDDDGSQVNAIGSVEGQILTFAAANDLEFKVGTSSIVGNVENNRMIIRNEGVNVTNTLSAIGNLSTALTGVVSVFATNNTVGGTGTKFITELKVGDAIKIGTQKFTVASIIDDVNLTIDSLFVAPDVTNVTAYTDANLFSIKNGDNQEKVTISKTGHLNIGTHTRDAVNYAYSLNLLDNNSAISFGDNTLTTQNVLVGEFGVGDTDKLWLHGKRGTIFSYDGDANESIQRAMTIGEEGYVAVNDTLQNSTLLERFSVRGNTYMKSSNGADGNLNIKATQINQLTYGYANVGAGDLVIGGHGTTTQQPAVISLINQSSTIGANQDLGVIQFAGKDPGPGINSGYCSTQIIASTSASGSVGSGSSGGGVLRFLTGGTQGGSFPTEAMRIDTTRNVGINTGTNAPQSRLQVNGGIQMANDTATASSAKVGTLRYRKASTGPASYSSYVDMCMETGVGSYQWVNIKTISW